MPTPPLDSDNPLIEKKILYAGTKSIDFKNGTKVHFHVQTRLCDADRTLLDDSRKMGTGKALELILGKKFKLEVWEVIVQKMALNEVAAFTVNKTLVQQYPFVSKTLRDANRPDKGTRSTHGCAWSMQSDGIGYDDLTALLKNPSDLEFTIEVTKVEEPDEYEKESWQFSENEKIELIPQLRASGNEQFKKRNYKAAAESYAKAIGIIEELMLKEKPHDIEWNELARQKVPLLLNYSQCKLIEGDYYATIEHCTSVLSTEPENVKAHFRRAKAHVGAWNPAEAMKDFEKVMVLDSSLTTTVKKELQTLEKLIKRKDGQDKEKFKKLFG